MSHDQPTTSPFRKVSTGTWADRRVMNLSRLEPSGQAMFVMLLIGPQTTNMPGVQPVGRLAFAEMLDWESEAFDKAFQEVFEQGLAKADWKARFVFVPKSIQHNLPQSPNVVKSWASTWARVPDCELKREAWHTIFQALTALGKSFADAFKTACPLGDKDDGEGVEEATGKATAKPSKKATDKPSGKATDNQEQEQEKEKKQEQDQKQTHASQATDQSGNGDAAAGGDGAQNHDNPPTDPTDGPGAGANSVQASGHADLPTAPDDTPPAATLSVSDLVAEGVDKQHAKDWLKVRKVKGAPLTLTAWNDVKAEATKAGLTPAQAVAKSAANSWQGFKAIWLKPRGEVPAFGAHGGNEPRKYGTGGRL